MRVMSDGIQKVAGSKLQNALNFMTRNRGMAVLTGFLITAVIQSSSATTVMVVSFANAALLTLSQAIGVIMGANIGTTITTWIVSFFGFKFSISAIALPIIGIGFPLIFSKKHKRRDLGEFIVGFGILFVGLGFLKDSVPDIKNNTEILAFVQNYTDLGIWSYFLFVFLGTLLTVTVQSSSAAMAVTVTLAFKGWIDLPTSAAIVLGENIGTTITAYLASLGTNVNARRAARAHFFFNIIGVMWMTLVFPYFLKLVQYIAPWDPAVKENFPLTLALFHTMFNTTNMLLFIGFVPQYTKFIEKIVRPRKRDLAGVYKLQYIRSSIQDTAQLNIINAKKEVLRMGKLTEDLFNLFYDMFFHPDKKQDEKIEKARQIENLTDQMQEEISKYLVECYTEELSDENVGTVNALMRITHEVENIADACFNLVLLTQRMYDKKIQFHKNANKEIEQYSQLVREFANLYKNHLDSHLNTVELNRAYELEKGVDNLRRTFTKSARKRIQEGEDVRSELLYLDMIKHFEHLGDNSLNIVQALQHVH
jgi:phosphate:Na+ symporter